MLLPDLSSNVNKLFVMRFLFHSYRHLIDIHVVYYAGLTRHLSVIFLVS